jgi:parvulin-like peptidyl-prolyl isomerase
MRSAMDSRRWLTTASLAGALLLAGCSGPLGPLIAGSPTPSPTLAPPTAAPPPLAAQVNGESIELAEFEEEVARFEAAQGDLGTNLATLEDYRGQVLQALIDRRLLSQGARATGLTVDQAAVSGKVDQLAAGLGSNEAMGAWLAENGYSLESFMASLAEEMEAERMVAQIAAGVPASADQVHGRHVLVASREEAEGLLQELAAGADFAALAQAASLDLSTRPVGGDLGWFPRGYLTVPEVEEAAFSLQPGEVSGIVESGLGFHIVQTIEHSEHPLSPDALQRMQQLAVQSWLTSQRQTATIEILVSP